MLAVSDGALWAGAGRADGMRATEARPLTGRRRTGRAIGLGATAFLRAAGLRAFALAAAFLRAGLPPLRADLPDAFDLPLAMLASCYPPIARERGTFTQRTGF